MLIARQTLQSHEVFNRSGFSCVQVTKWKTLDFTLNGEKAEFLKLTLTHKPTQLKLCFQFKKPKKTCTIGLTIKPLASHCSFDVFFKIKN
jgi:hypothetical protein